MHSSQIDFNSFLQSIEQKKEKNAYKALPEFFKTVFMWLNHGKHSLASSKIRINEKNIYTDIKIMTDPSSCSKYALPFPPI